MLCKSTVLQYKIKKSKDIMIVWSFNIMQENYLMDVHDCLNI